MFKKLLAMVIYYKHNIQILHWKVGGLNFQENHEELGELYDEMSKHIDAIAELGLQCGENPISLQETLSILNEDSHEYVVVNPTLNYIGEDSFKCVLTMFKEIMNEIEGICKKSELSEAQRNDLGGLSSWYSLRVNYLIPRRFM
jgi:DNA-binding ferritin-like protein